MARMIAIYIFVWALVMVGITGVQSLSGRQLWSAFKLLTFSAVCAIIAFALLMALVILF